jgi:hypothetical protein
MAVAAYTTAHHVSTPLLVLQAASAPWKRPPGSGRERRLQGSLAQLLHCHAAQLAGLQGRRRHQRWRLCVRVRGAWCACSWLASCLVVGFCAADLVRPSPASYPHHHHPSLCLHRCPSRLVMTAEALPTGSPVTPPSLLRGMWQPSSACAAWLQHDGSRAWEGEAMPMCLENSI